MSLYKYRIMAPGSLSKAEAIVDSRGAVEDRIPHGEHRVVKRYQGTKKLATYNVDRDIRGGVRWSMLSND